VRTCGARGTSRDGAGGEVMPRCGGTWRSRAHRRSRAHLGPQRARTPGHLVFSLQNSRFGGPPEGAMIATMDPRQADAVIVGEGDAPLWEYFSRLLSAVAPISDPKGLGPLDTSSFPCKTAVSARLH
jgi:hypothetical protein